jgi:hypothetical protein
VRIFDVERASALWITHNPTVSFTIFRILTLQHFGAAVFCAIGDSFELLLWLLWLEYRVLTSDSGFSQVRTS